MTVNLLEPFFSSFSFLFFFLFLFFERKCVLTLSYPYWFTADIRPTSPSGCCRLYTHCKRLHDNWLYYTTAVPVCSVLNFLYFIFILVNSMCILCGLVLQLWIWVLFPTLAIMSGLSKPYVKLKRSYPLTGPRTKYLTHYLNQVFIN